MANSGVVANIAKKTMTGSAVQLNSDATILPSTVYVEAAQGNAGVIYVGLSDVSSNKYICCLSAGQGFTFATDTTANANVGGAENFQLSSLYANGTSSDVLMVTYFLRYGTGTGYT